MRHPRNSAVKQRNGFNLAEARTCTIAMLMTFWVSIAVARDGPAFRGFWADSYHSGFTSAAESSELVSDVRSANGNALFIQVRRRGDVFYNSEYEPKAREVDPEYDPLADVLRQAHDTNAGPRLEVHAWVNAYPVWNGVAGTPSQTNHPFLLRPQWLDRNSRGETFNGSRYSFDPGHPQVQKHIFNIAMEIISKYEVDGLNLDYIRYPGQNWGYNSNSVARFNRLFGRTGQPVPHDPVWSQFRRDQVTTLVRKIYLSAVALKPKIKVSAATSTRFPAPGEDIPWERTSVYRDSLQDWRAWMEEGILDINLPMIYVFEHAPEHKDVFQQWTEFALKHRYNRHVVVAPGAFMNKIPDTIKQVRVAQEAGADGVCLYSYANPSSTGVSFDKFAAALTKRKEPGDHPPVFAERDSVPEMPWKTKPTTGHLKGFVSSGNPQKEVDGATVEIAGPVNRKTISDATGFYGSVDLPPGSYSVTASWPDHQPVTNQVTISFGKVNTVDITLAQ